MKHPPQEADAVSGGFVARIALGIVMTMAAALAVAYFLGGAHEQPIEHMDSDIHGIETSPFSTEAQGLESHRAAEQRLSSYGWVDRNRRIVHVPIDVAFDLWLAQHGASR